MDFAHFFTKIFQAFPHESPLLIAVFLLLFAMSLLSWYIIFWKGCSLRQEYRAYRKFHETYLNIKDWPARSNLKNIGGINFLSVNFLIAEVTKLEKILPHYSSHEAKKEILAMHLLQTLDQIRFRLDKGLTVLASIGSSSPFIGLFGTVIGIYQALKNVAAQGNAALAAVAGPMGEALIATAIGLFAAIPAVLAYNSFIRLNRFLIQNLRHTAEQMTVYLSNQAKKY
jgi:biopolymer transport protein ExbB